MVAASKKKKTTTMISRMVTRRPNSSRKTTTHKCRSGRNDKSQSLKSERLHQLLAFVNNKSDRHP